MAKSPITVNGRSYAWPAAPVVVVCIDGSEPDYMDRAIADGQMPWLAAARAEGTDRIAERSEERRVGKECVSTCRSRWSPSRFKKQNNIQQTEQPILLTK